MDAESVRIAESGTLTMPDVVWDRTKLISAAIAPLAAQSIVGRAAAGRPRRHSARAGGPGTRSRPGGGRVDFLPVVRRTLTRTGFVIDHVHYFANALKPWISRRDTLDPFLIRRDPRDLSRIWVLEPDGHLYVEVPYRTMANPVVSLWEHQRALARLHERGIAQVDEAALFRMIEQMRDIASTASKTTKRMRRDTQRRDTTTAAAKSRGPSRGAVVPPEPSEERQKDAEATAARVVRFDQIEQW